MCKKVYFRADAGPGIGYGHYIRSLALADMLKSDFECVMFTQQPTPYQVTEAEKICRLVSLPANESRFDVFLEYLIGDEIVVLDNYFYSTEYQRIIKSKGCKLVCIDDIHDKHYVADVVINHGLLSVDEFDVEPFTKVCVGSQFALLRKPFLQPIKKERRSGSWVVTIGGLDEPNVTLHAVKCIQQIGATDITAIIGDGYKHCGTLENVGVNILSCLSAKQMAEVFASTENVLCSASTVCYEALSQGCRVFAGWYVDNQIEIFAGLKKNSYVVPLGNLFELTPQLLLQPQRFIPVSFSGISSRYMGIFVILSLEMVNYVDMSEDYSRQVWMCRNRDEIRMCMSNPDKFSFDIHQKFIQGLKNNRNKVYYAFFFQGQFVASYDLIDIEYGDSANRGLFVNPLYQGMGIGEYIESQMIGMFINKYSLKILKADVLKNNLKSLKYHQSMGYSMINESDAFIYLEKQL